MFWLFFCFSVWRWGDMAGGAQENVDKSRGNGVSRLFSGTPFEKKGTPFAKKGTPFETKGVPFVKGGVPFATKGVPFAEGGVPFAAKGVPFAEAGVPLVEGGVTLLREGVAFVEGVVTFLREGVAFVGEGALFGLCVVVMGERGRRGLSEGCSVPFPSNVLGLAEPDFFTALK